MIFDELDLHFDDTPREAALNMAIDEALARSVTRPSLRVYRWARAAVSFGYFGRYADVAGRWTGRELVRRWTGGGEVPHGDDFTYTIVVPSSHPFTKIGVRESYRILHEALANLLPAATLAEADAAENALCFARPVVADVVVAGAKVAGAAQRRGSFGLLHQGSVQGTALPSDLAPAFAYALATTVMTIPLPPEIVAQAEVLRSERYGTEAWLKRR